MPPEVSAHSAAYAATGPLRHWLDVTGRLSDEGGTAPPAGADSGSITGLETRLGLRLDAEHRQYLSMQDGWEPTGRAAELAGALKIAPVRSLLAAPRTYTGPALEELTAADTAQELREAGISPGNYLVVAVDGFLGGSYLMPVRDGVAGPQVITLAGWVDGDTFIGDTFPTFAAFLESRADSAAANAERVAAKDEAAEYARRHWTAEPTIVIRGLPASSAEIAAGITRIVAALEEIRPVASWTIPAHRWDGSAADLERIMHAATRDQSDGTRQLFLAARGTLPRGGNWQVTLRSTQPAAADNEVVLLLHSAPTAEHLTSEEIDTLIGQAAAEFSPATVTASSIFANTAATTLGIPQPAGYRIWLRSDQLGPGTHTADTGDFTLTDSGSGILLSGPDHLEAEQIVTRSHDLVNRLVSGRDTAERASAGSRQRQAPATIPGEPLAPPDAAVLATRYADEIGEGYAGYLVRQEDVCLSRPIVVFLEACRSENRRPVLVTPQAATLSPALVRAIDEYGVYWAFQAPDGGVYDAASGLAIRSLPELWNPPEQPRPVHVDYRDVPGRGRETAALALDVRAHHRTTAGVEPLALATAALDAFEAVPRASGPFEPCLVPWNREQLTHDFRIDATGMQSTIVALEGKGSVTVDANAVPDGHEERVRGTFGLGHAYQGVTFKTVRKAENILRRLAEEFDVSSGLISLIEADGWTVGRTARAIAAPLPLALYIGEPLINSLGEATRDRLDEAVTRFRSQEVQWRGRTGALLGQSVDIDEFADLAHSFFQCDPALPDPEASAREPVAQGRRPGLLQRLLRRKGR